MSTAAARRAVAPYAAFLAALPLALGACGVDRQDAIDDLVEAGYETSSAECIMDALEADGYEAGDLVDPLPEEVQGAIETAVEGCITAADLAGLGESRGEDQLRQDVIDQLVAGGMDETEAVCIVDRVTGAGFTMIDLAQAGLEPEEESGVVAAIGEASLACQGGG